MRVYIELKRGENADVVLNNLFQQTQLQVTFGINMVALDGGQPKTLSLKSLLEIFVRHRREVVTRRTRYLLRKARERAHILEGLAVALANIDEMIELIRSSPNSAEAKIKMMARTWDAGLVTTLLAAADSSVSRPEDLSLEFGIIDAEGKAAYRLSDAQASAILEMRLSRLTGLEQDKIHDEFKELLASILDYLDILASETRLLGVIRGELLAIKEQYGEERRTEITNAALNMAQEDLIAPMDMVVTLSHEGYVKSVPLAEYQAQKRGGRGKLATANKQEDFVDRLWVAHTHDWLLCFGSTGKVYKLRVFELPTGSRGSRGKPFVNLLPLEQGEKISAVLPIKKFTDEPEQTEGNKRFIFMATRLGTVKKTELAAFANIRSNGIIALDLRVDDSLVGVALTAGNNDVLMFSDAGRVIRFNENDVRSMGRTATGVRGMRLVRRDESSEEAGSEAPVIDGEAEVAEAEETAQAQIIALIVVSPAGAEGQAAPDILTVSENGYGKRTPIEQFPLRGRGGMGVIAQALTDKTGNLIGAVEVGDEHQVMLISESANLIRFKTTDVRSMGRNTQGVRLMKPNAGDRLVGVDRIAIEADDEAAADDTAAPLEGPTDDAGE